MKTILITGFAPFGGETVNPSWEAVRRLPDQIGAVRLVKLCLPVVFGKAPLLAWEAAQECNADAVLCIGQAGGRNAVTPEQVAINLRAGSTPDNEGNVYTDTPVWAEAPAAYFSDLPVRRMTEALTDAGIPAKISYTAGTYVCNDTLFTLLHLASLRAADYGKRISVGFVHIPFLPEQAKAGLPCLPLETATKALHCIVSVLYCM